MSRLSMLVRNGSGNCAGANGLPLRALVLFVLSKSIVPYITFINFLNGLYSLVFQRVPTEIDV